jgi:glutamate/tyrosine decarboxylase-like PLP-dependent enzyme
MDPPVTWASVLGAAAAAASNNNMLMEELSPSFTRLERELVGWFASEIGLGSCAGGTLTAGGSLANLLALAVARDDYLRQTPASGSRSRFGITSRLTIVTSRDAHSSIAEAARLLGLDPDAGVISVEPDSRGRLLAPRVERALRDAEQAGRTCFCLVATAGTTVLGAIDPLDELGALARSRSMWFHVDAAHAGALCVSLSRKALLSGIGAADSVTVNPHKWLYVSKICALALFGDAGRWRDALPAHVPYTLPGQDETAVSGGQIEGSRHADVLKLRLSLLQMGRAGYERLFEHGFQLARCVEQGVRQRPFLELAAPVATNVVVFRVCGDDHEQRDELTETLCHRLRERADMVLSLPGYRDQRWMRAVMLSPFTRRSTIDALFSAIDDFAAEEGL